MIGDVCAMPTLTTLAVYRMLDPKKSAQRPKSNIIVAIVGKGIFISGEYA